MKLTTWSRSISGHSPTLADHLRVSVYDYQRAFGHEPKLVVVPYFRRDELAASVGPLYPCGPEFGSENEFMGIPLKFSIISECIELKGSR